MFCIACRKRRNHRGQLFADHPFDRLHGGLPAVLFGLAANRFRLFLRLGDDLQRLGPDLGQIPIRLRGHILEIERDALRSLISFGGSDDGGHNTK